MWGVAMPFEYVNQDQIEPRVGELERSGQKIVQVLKVADRWAIVHVKAQGRPPIEKRPA